MIRVHRPLVSDVCREVDLTVLGILGGIPFGHDDFHFLVRLCALGDDGVSIVVSLHTILLVNGKLTHVDKFAINVNVVIEGMAHLVSHSSKQEFLSARHRDSANHGIGDAKQVVGLSPVSQGLSATVAVGVSRVDGRVER